MELRHLRYFVAVCQKQSFTKAAEKLFIAQPPFEQTDPKFRTRAWNSDYLSVEAARLRPPKQANSFTNMLLNFCSNAEEIKSMTKADLRIAGSAL